MSPPITSPIIESRWFTPLVFHHRLPLLRRYANAYADARIAYASAAAPAGYLLLYVAAMPAVLRAMILLLLTDAACCSAMLLRD